MLAGGTPGAIFTAPATFEIGLAGGRVREVGMSKKTIARYLMPRVRGGDWEGGGNAEVLTRVIFPWPRTLVAVRGGKSIIGEPARRGFSGPGSLTTVRARRFPAQGDA